MLRKPLEGESGGDGSFAVKRVAALPRERPGIRGGNLLANGDLVHKTLRELSDSAVLVHDNDFRPASVSSNQRWKPHSPETVGWTVKEKSLHFESTAGHDESQWMDYEHWHGTGSPAPRTEPAILQDNDSYNQADKRGLNLVHDIMVRCHVEGENGDIMLVLHDQPHQFLVHFQLNSRTFLVRRRNQTVFSGRLPEPARHFTLEAALCDGNLLVGYNQLPLTSIPYDENPESPSQPSASPLQPRLQIGAYGGPLDITHIQVWRDLYHLTPSGLSGEWQSAAPLGEDRYFLLGDNPPVSIDSRHWGSGIARDQIVGRVIPLSR
jgi:hypothetical protein